jgi:GAF domain-containing protein
MAAVSTPPPSDVMSLTWHNLTPDEQFFQSVLSAAFTIQEHNDRRKLVRQTPARQTQAEPEAHDRAFDMSALDKAEAISQWSTEATEDLAPDAGLTVQPFQLSASDDARTGAPTDASRDSTELLNRVPNHLLREIVQQALRATHATGAAIALKQQGALICRASAGDFASEFSNLIDTESGFTGVCTSSATMQLCSNTALDSRVDADACRKLGISAIIVVPLLHQDRLVGLIAVFSRQPYAFGMLRLQALQDLAEEFAVNLQLTAESANANTRRDAPGRL